MPTKHPSLRSIFAVGLALAGLLVSCEVEERLKALQVDPVAFATVKDGTYEAAEDYWPVTAKVRLTVAGGQVTDLQLLSHGHGPDHGAEALVEVVLAAQSLEVDSVAGATYSSKVVRKAIETALRRGL